jgi:hypothetical protein
MSTDYTYRFAVGYMFTERVLETVFGEAVPEVSRFEDRFNSITGKKTKPEKVIVREMGLVYKFKGKELKAGTYSDIEPIAEAIAAEIGCRYHLSICDFDTGNMAYFSPAKLTKEVGKGVDWGHIDTPAAISVEAVITMAPELKRIAAALKKLGLAPGKPAIHLTYNVG